MVFPPLHIASSTLNALASSQIFSRNTSLCVIARETFLDSETMTVITITTIKNMLFNFFHKIWEDFLE